MKIFPAIDLYEGKAVRLLKGDYNAVTIYSENPLRVFFFLCLQTICFASS